MPPASLEVGMVNELMNAMRVSQASTGHPVTQIRLSRDQYRELVAEIKSNPRYRDALNYKGEVDEINGAKIEVV
jgi:hypothetical protein